MTVVIADEGPLIALSRINKLEIFQQISITNTACDENLDNDHQKGKTAIKKAIKLGWVKVQTVNSQGWKAINSGVDAGEASAIYLALQSRESTLLIIDDQAGRAEAKYQKITLMGTAAVIGMAKMQGHILSAKEVMYALRDSEYYIGESIVETVLRDIGE